MTNFQFKDALGNNQTAGAASVGGALYTQIQIVDSTSSNTVGVTPAGELLVKGSIVSTISPTSVSGVGIFNINPVGNGSVITTAQPASVSGVGTFNVNHVGNGSIITAANPASVSGVGLFNVNHVGSGSVLTLIQSSVITVWQNSSILAVPVGSTITVFQNPSIVGTYLEDNPSSSGDRGIFSLNVRNDTMSSVTSADGDYGAMSVGPVGEVLTANAPITKWFSAQTSVMYGTSVQAVSPAGSSVFNYITGMQVANNSSIFSLVKITGGLGSVLAWTVAPGNGGSNINFINPLRAGDNSGISASISGTSSVYISMQGFTAKT